MQRVITREELKRMHAERSDERAKCDKEIERLKQYLKDLQNYKKALTREMKDIDFDIKKNYDKVEDNHFVKAQRERTEYKELRADRRNAKIEGQCDNILENGRKCRRPAGGYPHPTQANWDLCATCSGAAYRPPKRARNDN